MNISVIGTGYVGLVVGACLAETGNDVCCADIDREENRRPQEERPADLRAGPGVDSSSGIRQRAARPSRPICRRQSRPAEVIFIAVGTPPGEDGSADLKHVLKVAELIGRHMSRETVVVTKSTVPVGTARKVAASVGKEAQVSDFHMCSNPEFLKEGAAVEDFMRPDRVVLGVDSAHARKVMTDLYAPFVRTGKPILVMDIPSAEMTKYAANGMLATRISFMNEIANLCEKLGANVDHVRKGIGSDSRIGQSFLFPGPGYGGSCFPKDVKALVQTAGECGLPLDVLAGVETANARQKRVLSEKVRQALGGELSGRRIALWGLAFKAGTDDMREAPSLTLIDALLGAGATHLRSRPSRR